MKQMVPAAPAEAKGVLEARDVSLSFKLRGNSLWPWAPMRQVRALAGVSLSVRRGEMLGIAGESGCGKSTLARLLLKLIHANEGSVLLDGQPLESYPLLELRERVQMVFQDPFTSLNPRRRVGDIIADSLIVHGMGPPAERRSRVVAMLERVGLAAHHYDRFPHEFSGGQRQRIAIARALIIRPEFLILDEPTSALDVSVQARVVELIQELRRELDLGCIFITHDLNLLGFLSDRLAVMYLGRVVETGPTSEIFSRPKHPYTKALLAATPSPDPQRRVQRIDLEGEIPSSVNVPSGCPFHTRCPEKIGTICQTVRPTLARQGDVQVSCHLYGDKEHRRASDTVGASS